MKFNENCSKDSGDMEWTRIEGLPCDLESRYLGHVLCTLSH